MALTTSVHAARATAGEGVVTMSDGVGQDVERETLSDADFKRELAAVIPHLRAFGRSLSGNPVVAEDLVARQSAEEGKSVSVSLGLGGRRSLKKKTTIKTTP